MRDAPREQRDWAPETGSLPVGDTMHGTTANETNIDYTEMPAAGNPMARFTFQPERLLKLGLEDVFIFQAGKNPVRTQKTIFL